MYKLCSITYRVRDPTPVRLCGCCVDMSCKRQVETKAARVFGIWGGLDGGVRRAVGAWRWTGIHDEPRLRASFVLLFRSCYRTKGSNPSTLTGCAASAAVTMGLWWTGRGCRSRGGKGGGGGRRRWYCCRRTRRKDLKLRSRVAGQSIKKGRWSFIILYENII